MKSIGKNKYGVPRYLSNGKTNPEYDFLYHLATRGRHPKNKYGVPRKLPNGKMNPEWMRRYYAAHSKQINQYLSEQRKTNPEKFHRWQRNGYARHRDENIERSRKWAKAHPERANATKVRNWNKRKRNLPTERIIGYPLKGFVLHHMTPNVGVFIPEGLHRSIYHNIWTGKGMQAINLRAAEWII